MNIENAVSAAKQVSETFFNKAMEKFDNMAKPLRSLGIMENCIARIAAVQNTENVDISKRALVVMCADNGVTAQNVTQTDQMVTTIVAEQLVKGTSTVSTMAKYLNVDVIPVDIGISSSFKSKGLLDKKIMKGTNDFTKMPAMSSKQALEAIETGINIALDLKNKGYKLIATGEMGIGNTTTSAAVISVLCGKEPEDVTGRGAGLDNEGLIRKIQAVKKGIQLNKPDSKDPVDTLAKVGGLDIAGLTGIFIGGAAAGLPVLIDGVISGTAALLAAKISPLSKSYMIATHLSKEPAGKALLEELNLKPFITAEMCLGEGTGAMAGLALIDLILYSYHTTITFQELGSMEKYVHFR